MIARDTIKAIGALLPLRFAIQKVNPRVVAVFYHTICNAPKPHVKHLYPTVTPAEFGSHLDFLIKYFEPISLKEFIENKQELQSGKPKLLISFDDGFREVKTIAAPILRDKQIPATIFVNPSFVGNNNMFYRCKASLIVDKVIQLGKTINTPQAAQLAFPQEKISTKKFCNWVMQLEFKQQDLLTELANNFDIDIRQYLTEQHPYLNLGELLELAKQGFTIGAHSLTHPNFASIPLTEQIRQVEDSLSWVNSNIPNQPKAFAFPYSNDGIEASFYKYFMTDHPERCDIFFE